MPFCDFTRAFVSNGQPTKQRTKSIGLLATIQKDGLCYCTPKLSAAACGSILSSGREAQRLSISIWLAAPLKEWTQRGQERPFSSCLLGRLALPLVPAWWMKLVAAKCPARPNAAVLANTSAAHMRFG